MKPQRPPSRIDPTQPPPQWLGTPAEWEDACLERGIFAPEYAQQPRPAVKATQLALFDTT